MLSAAQFSVFQTAPVTSKLLGAIRIAVVPVNAYYSDAAVGKVIDDLTLHFAQNAKLPANINLHFCYATPQQIVDSYLLNKTGLSDRNVSSINGCLELKQLPIVGYQLTTRDINHVHVYANSLYQGFTKQSQVSFQNDYSVPLLLEFARTRSIRKASFFKYFQYQSDAISFEEAAIRDYWPLDSAPDGIVGLAKVKVLDARTLHDIEQKFLTMHFEGRQATDMFSLDQVAFRLCIECEQALVETPYLLTSCTQAYDLVTGLVFDMGQDINAVNKSIKNLRAGRQDKVQLLPHQYPYYISDFWFSLNKYDQYQELFVPSASGKYYLAHPQAEGADLIKTRIFSESERAFFCENRYMNVRVPVMRYVLSYGIRHLKFGMLEEAYQLFEHCLVVSKQSAVELVAPLLCYQLSILDRLGRENEVMQAKLQEAVQAIDATLQSGFPRVAVDAVCFLVYLALKSQKLAAQFSIYFLLQRLHLLSRFLQPGIGNNKQVFSTLQMVDDYIHHSASIQLFYALKLQLSRYTLSGQLGFAGISLFCQGQIWRLSDALAARGTMPIQLCQMLCGHYNFCQTLILSHLHLLNLFDNYYFIKHGFYIPFVQHSTSIVQAARSRQQTSPIISRVSKFVASQESSLSFVLYEVDWPVISLRQTRLTKFIYFKFQRPLLVIQQPVVSFCSQIEQHLTMSTDQQKSIDLLASRLFDIKLSFPLLQAGNGLYEQLTVHAIQLSEGFQIYILYQSFNEVSKAIILRCELSTTSDFDDIEEICVESILAQLGNIQLYIPIKKKILVLGSYCFPILQSVQIVNQSYFLKRHGAEHIPDDSYYFCYKMQFVYYNLLRFHLNTDSAYQAYYYLSEGEDQRMQGFAFSPSPRQQKLCYCELQNQVSSSILYILTKFQPSERRLRYVYSFMLAKQKVTVECVIHGELYSQKANFTQAYRVLGGEFCDTTNLYVTNSENQLIASRFGYVKAQRVYLHQNDTANLTLAQGKEYTSDLQSQLSEKSYRIERLASRQYKVRFTGQKCQFQEFELENLEVKPICCYLEDQADLFGEFVVRTEEPRASMEFVVRFADSQFVNRIVLHFPSEY